MKVSELTGAQLGYWVARADGLSESSDSHGAILVGEDGFWIRPSGWMPSTDWAQGGPLIDKYRLAVSPFYYKNNNGWVIADADDRILSEGSTALEAVCREVVRLKFGDEVPDEAPEVQ